MKTAVEIIPKEITASKGSGAVKRKRPTVRWRRKREMRRDIKGGVAERRMGMKGGKLMLINTCSF